MKKMISRRNFLKACTVVGSAAALTACGGGSSSSTAAGSTAGSAAASSTSGPQTITFYPRDANLSSGLISGFKGDYFAEHGFNLDVWAYRLSDFTFRNLEIDAKENSFDPAAVEHMVCENCSVTALDTAPDINYIPPVPRTIEEVL